MIVVTKIFRFESAHRLPCYDGDCSRLHGHSYKLSVSVARDIYDNTEVITDKNSPKVGMVMDFKDLKKIVNDVVIKKYDHSYLNDFFENPTAEIMVSKIAEEIKEILPKSLRLINCKLWETEDSYAEYIAE